MALLIDYLFPVRCYACGQGGQYLCPVCVAQLHTLAAVHPPEPSPLDGYVRLFRYKNAIRSLIEDLKYQFCFDLVSQIGELMATSLQADYPNLLKYWQSEHFCLTPIPLHSRRCNWRGFNQSQLLANNLSLALQLDISLALIRPNYGVSQVSQKTKLARATNIQGAFAVDNKFPISGSNILILDDVITTGSTLTQAAQTLKSAGAFSVWGLSFAG